MVKKTVWGADTGEKSKWVGEEINLMLTLPKRRYLAFSVGILLPVFWLWGSDNGSERNLGLTQRAGSRDGDPRMVK